VFAIDIHDRQTTLSSSSSVITYRGTDCDHHAVATYLSISHFSRNSLIGNLPTAAQYHTVSQYNKTFNFSLGRLELIVGWETVTVDPIKLNHSVIPSAHVYVIMVAVDMAFDKMYDKRKEKTFI